MDIAEILHDDEEEDVREFPTEVQKFLVLQAQRDKQKKHYQQEDEALKNKQEEFAPYVKGWLYENGSRFVNPRDSDRDLFGQEGMLRLSKVHPRESVNEKYIAKQLCGRAEQWISQGLMKPMTPDNLRKMMEKEAKQIFKNRKHRKEPTFNIKRDSTVPKRKRRKRNHMEMESAASSSASAFVVPLPNFNK